PDPRLCLDRPVVPQRHHRAVPALARAWRARRLDPGHRMGRPARHRLRLPAVHGAAALCRPGEARHQPAGSGGRPRRQAVCRFSHHHAAAVGARHRRRLPAGLHPRRRRVRDSRSAGRHRHADDRQGAVGRILHQCRLAARLGGGDLPAGAAGRADRPVPAPAGAEPGEAVVRAARVVASPAAAALCFGYAFLYLPIALVIVYSFNASRLVTVWAGFSLHWWGALLHNEAMLSAAWLSLRVAIVSASLAALLGLAAGYALARVPRFWGRTLFASLVIAPMV